MNVPLHGTVSLFALATFFLGALPQTAEARFISNNGLTPEIRASQDRCERLAGRERARCENVNERRRLRLRRSTSTVRQENITRRQRRALPRRFTPVTNVRERGTQVDRSLRGNQRQHMTSGNARRNIRRAFEEARSRCSQDRGPGRSQCLQEHLKNAQRQSYGQ